MPITFPNSPSTGDTHTTSNGLQYTYDGEKWTTIGTNSAGTWTRTGTTVSLTTATDDLNANTATFSGAVNFDDNVIVKGDGTNGSGELTLNCENNSHGIKIKGPPHSAGATYTLTLPNNTGTSGQVLTTNGSGVSSWSTVDLASRLPLTGGTLTGGLTGTTAGFSGNVGIGTTSPANRLTVINRTTPIALKIGENDNATTEAGLEIQARNTANTSAYSLQIAVDANAPAATVDFAGSERLRIDSSGNVGINNSSPSSYNSDGRNLVVGSGSGSQGLTIASGTSGYGNIYFADGTSGDALYSGMLSYYHADNHMQFRTASTERMRIDSSGRLLVGSSSAISGSAANDNLQLVNSAGSILSVASSDTTIASGTRIGEVQFWGQPGSTWGNFATIGCFGDNSAASNDNPGRLTFSTTADGASSPTERMRLDSAGNVGIGKTSPNTTFEIYESTNPYIYLQNSTTGTGAGDGFSIVEFGVDAYINNREAGNMIFYNNNSERMRIDSSGRLSLGATSSTVLSTFALSSTNAYSSTGNISNDNVGLKLFNTNGSDGTGANNYTGIQFNVASGATSSGSLAYVRTADNQGAFVFNQRTGASSYAEAMRIDSSGNVLFGSDQSTTPWNRSSGSSTLSWLEDKGNAGGSLALANSADNGFAGIYINKFDYNPGDDNRFIDFRINGGSSIGTITYNGTGTSYNTSSDYRLKENVVALTNGIDRLKQLNVNRFNFIGNTVVVDGFIAHEAQAVVPEAVTGEKDGEEMQGIDQSKLVPLLTAALQEAITKIETLETKVAALEAG